MQRNPVREARLDRLWKQSQLARKAKVSQTSVHKAETGKLVGPLTQAKIARALDMPRSELFPEGEAST